MYEILKKIIDGLGGFVYSVFENIVPDSVKSKLKDLGAATSAGSFKGMFMAIFGLILHWYFLMITVSVIVLYRLYKALDNAGVINKFGKIIESAITSVFYISEVCFPQITNLKVFFHCIQGAP